MNAGKMKAERLENNRKNVFSWKREKKFVFLQH